jgi:YHS domain-containing protein
LGLEGYCPVELTDAQHWVRGDTRWGLTYRGRTYLFAGPDQRDRFDAAPDRYAPVMAGADVVLAVDQGDTVPGQRRYGAWFEDRVYLFSSESTLRRFDDAPYRYVSALQEREQSTARRPAYGPRVDRPAPNSASQAPYAAWR